MAPLRRWKRGEHVEACASDVRTGETGAPDIDAVMALLRPFGDAPLVLKDYVKSQKHYWNEACFIPHAADRATVERVVRRFLELQGPDLNEGLVFREFVPLKVVGKHPRSGMPLSAEVRTFWLDRQLVLAEGYWHGFEDLSASAPIDAFADVVARVPSRFFVMDLALRARRRGSTSGWAISPAEATAASLRRNSVIGRP